MSALNIAWLALLETMDGITGKTFIKKANGGDQVSNDTQQPLFDTGDTWYTSMIQ